MSQEDKAQADKNVHAFYQKGYEKQREKQRIEDLGWDLKFQKHVDYVISAQNDMDRNFRLAQRLLDHVGKFRESAKEEVVKIIDQLDRPLNERKRLFKHNAALPFNQHMHLNNWSTLSHIIDHFCDEQ